jgi:hypothetical protein
MSIILTPFSPSADTPFGGDVTSASVNTPDNNLEAWVQANVKANPVLVTSATPVNLDSTNLYVYGSPALTGQQINLPLIGSTNLVYIIHKDNSNKGTITVTPAGGNTINGLSNYILYTEASSIMIEGNGTNWRIVNENFNKRKLFASAYQSASITLTTTGFFQIPFQTTVENLNSDFASNTFTCSVPGIYMVSGQVTYADNLSSYADTFLYKNGVNFRDIGAAPSTGTNYFAKTGFSLPVRLVVGDTLAVYGRSSVVNRQTFASQTATYINFQWTSF